MGQLNPKLIEYLRQQQSQQQSQSPGSGGWIDNITGAPVVESAQRREAANVKSRSLHAPPPGGPQVNSPLPGQPMGGPTVALNQPNQNTVRIGAGQTGGRSYTPNPFNSQQAPIRPPPTIQPATPNRPIKGTMIPGKKPGVGMAGPGSMIPQSGGALASIRQSGGTGIPGMGPAGSPANMGFGGPPPQMAPGLQTPQQMPQAPQPPMQRPVQNHMMPPQMGQQAALIRALRGRQMR